MSYFQKCMEEIERDEECAHTRAIEEHQRMMQTTQLVAGMAMLEEEGEGSRGSHSGRAPNRDRKRHDRGKNLLEDYFIPRSVYPEEEFRRRYRMASHLFARIMADVCNVDNYFVQKPDALGVMGLLPEQKMTAVLRMLAYGASADQVDEIARLGDSTALKCLDKFCKAIIKVYRDEYLRRPSRAELRKLLQKGDQRGFPGMTGSIDCMHWEWKNCPTAWEGQFSNRKGTTTIILEAVASYDTRIWHAFFGVAGSQNDLNVLSQSDVFDDVVNGQAPRVEYDINGTRYKGTYYLADGIYPQWQTFVKTIPRPNSAKEKLFSTKQEAYRKDVERCFGILQARWGMVRGAARLFDEFAIGRIMTACIILHNMIVEDEFDYDSEEFLGEDPFNSSRTRVYDLPHGPDGQPLQHPPVGRDVEYVSRCVQRYSELHTNFIHRQRQHDLIEHIWNEEGNN